MTKIAREVKLLLNDCLVVKIKAAVDVVITWQSPAEKEILTF